MSRERAAESLDRDQLCGVGSFRPRAIQTFAKPNVFTLLYSTVLILQNAQFYYFFAIMSTLQRRYGLSSWSIAVILFADSASPFFISFVVGHYSRMVSKPLMLFWGIVALVVSCCVSVVPYVVYGPGYDIPDHVGVKSNVSLDMCHGESASRHDCGSWMTESVVTTGLLFAAHFFYGGAYSVLYIAGSTYVDDSVKKKNSPLHFAFVSILKLLGPTLGYTLGSVCLRYYEDLRYDPGFERTDPRWIGAWWLGYTLLAVGLAVFALPIALFPKHLSPTSHPSPPTTQQVRNSTEVGFWSSLRSLYRNPVYVSRLVYWLLASNVTLGHGMMSSKYVEVHFRTSASQASFLIGPFLLATNVLGLGIGGLVLHTLRPRPRLVTAYTTLADLVKLGLLLACMLIGCHGIELVGGTPTSESRPILNASCNTGCSCTTGSFQPICEPENGSVYFSPCFAGCNEGVANADSLSWEACSCLEKPAKGGRPPFLGLCDDHCQDVVTFLILTSLLGFITRTTTVGHTIVGLRCVARHEKAIALGVQEGLSSVFTYIPYPILYGAVFDSACLVWEDKCGEPGVCWIYDTDKLRYLYHALSSGILLFAIVFEVLMSYHSVRMTDFYSDGTSATREPYKEEDPNDAELKTKMVSEINGDVVAPDDDSSC